MKKRSTILKETIRAVKQKIAVEQKIIYKLNQLQEALEQELRKEV